MTHMTKSQFEQIDPQLRALTMLTTLVVDDADEEQVSSCLKKYTYEEYGGITMDRLEEVLGARRKESSEKALRRERIILYQRFMRRGTAMHSSVYHMTNAGGRPSTGEQGSYQYQRADGGTY